MVFFRVSFTCVSIMYVILHRFCIDLYLSVNIDFSYSISVADLYSVPYH